MKDRKGALESADSKGHDMLRFETVQSKDISFCNNCGAKVVINGDDISGDAIATECPVTPMLGMATWCVKIVPSQKHPYFFYVDAADEETALALGMEQDEVGGDDTFGQVGIFFTHHMLHELARASYLMSKGE